VAGAEAKAIRLNSVKVTLFLIVALLGLVCPVEALILTGTGNQPVHDPGWPSGAVDVANLPSRIGWWEGPPFGGGEWHFEFRGKIEVFQQVLDAFAKIKPPVLDLFVHDATQNSFVLDPNHKTATNNIDWTFTVWVPDRWQALYGSDHPIMFSDDPNAGKAMPPPRIDLYLGGNSQVAFDQVTRPPNVTFHDERAITAGVDTRTGTVLQITVSDATSHLPIAGAQAHVTTRDENGRYTKPLINRVSNEKGVALVTGLPAGVFQISAVAPGYVEAVIAYGDYPEHSFQKFEVSPARAGSVSGTVVDETGTGVPGIHLIAANTLVATNVPYRTLNKPEATTDGAGRFTVSGLPVGLVQLWVQSTNFFLTNIFAYEPVPATGLSLGVRPSGSLLVRVVDAAGHGLQQWKGQQLQVEATPSTGAVRGSWGGSANVGSDGTYFFAGVHPATYVVSVLNSTSQKRIRVAPRERAEVVLQLP
jgi:hypothetical protein